MRWFALPQGAWGIGASLADVDPCLVWANATAAADFVRPGSSLDQAMKYAALAVPSFSLRGGTREILRGIIAKGLDLR